MSELRTTNLNPWSLVGGPAPGTVAALAALGEGEPIFAGTRTGLYRTDEIEQGVQARWQRLPGAPLEIISLGLSPQYSMDATLLAGAAQGIFVSRDGGEQWRSAHTPMPDPVVLCLAFSPNYQADGIVLAGTLEDGVYYSGSRGEHWSFRGFGMLDAAVYSLAISPDFARDETLFAGTESALYYSYNGALAWKQLDFPEEAAPILSLAISPHFAEDQTLYAGTEEQGLYRSVDGGQSWQKTGLPATCVNTLAVSPQDGTLFAATNSGLYASGDGGQHWNCLLALPDAFSLSVSVGRVITGPANQGAWLTCDRIHWQPCFTPPARALTGLLLSSRFDVDAVAFLYGAQEGIWRTTDGGLSWRCLNENLPDLEIHSMAAAPATTEHPLPGQILIAASTGGLLLSEDAGDHWSLLAETPAARVAFSPGGRWLAAASLDGEIRVANRPVGPWQHLPLPAEMHGEVLALAIGDDALLRIALLNRAQELVNIWAGVPGRFTQLLSQPASPTPVAGFWAPPDGAGDTAWYASLDHQVWAFRGGRLMGAGEGAVLADLILDAEDGSRVLSLTGSHSESGSLLFACTGQAIYRSTGTNSWITLHHFGDETAISLALSPTYAEDSTAYALLLGGSFCRGILK
jgi:photosystem II stability/assembly factor-like uncharacterized protein